MQWQSVSHGIAQARREMSAREHRDVTNEEIANAVGVTPAAYSRWEKGQRTPGEEDVQKLAKFFGVSPAFLRYGISDVVMVGGLPIDRSTIHTFTPEEIAQFKRELAEEEAKKAAKPSPRKRKNG